MSIDQVEQLNQISNFVKNTKPIRKEKSRIGKKEYENSSRFDHTQEYQELKLYQCNCKTKYFSLFNDEVFEQVRKAFLYDKNEKQRNLAIRNYLDVTFDSSLKRHEYTVASIKICRKAFLKLIGASENKFNEIWKRKHQGIDEQFHKRKETDAFNKPELGRGSVIFFLQNIRDNVAECNPNDLNNASRNERDVCFLPCMYTRKSLLQEYKAWCEG
jgi:hypothetical protein